MREIVLEEHRIEIPKNHILNHIPIDQDQTMSIFLTSQVSYNTKIEAFDIRGLQNQVSVKAFEAGVYPLSRSSLETRIRYGHLESELKARLNGKPQEFCIPPKYANVLPKFDRFQFEAPTLIVEMKSGGEVLHAFGMFETGTSKMGLYAGQPSSEHMRQIMTLGLDVYSSVPAGNVNIAGYCAYIQAWRGINAFFIPGGGDVSKQEAMIVGIQKKTIDGLAESCKEKNETFSELHSSIV